MAAGKPLYRRIKQLYAFGYIIYETSFNPVIKNRVVLVRVDCLIKNDLARRAGI